MTRLNGPQVHWTALVVATGLLAMGLYHIVVKPVAGMMGWSLP